MKKIFCLVFVLSCFNGFAQVSLRDSSINMVITSVHFAAHAPAGDMSKRYGYDMAAGAEVTLKRANKWMYGLDFDYLFGNNIKEQNILSGIATSDGGIIGQDGQYAEIRAYERGYIITFNIGKVFSVKKPNPNCGFVAKLGGGFMEHKIRIETIGNTVPYLDKEYKKGYDRLTNGFTMHQYIGYQYLSNKGLINFFGGIESYQGFTQNRRSFNFDQMQQDTQKRVDILFGVKVGWILPLYKKAASDYYYN